MLWRLLLSLCSWVTFSSVWRPYVVPGTWTRLAGYKANTLRPVLSLWTFFAFYKAATGISQETFCKENAKMKNPVIVIGNLIGVRCCAKLFRPIIYLWHISPRKGPSQRFHYIWVEGRDTVREGFRGHTDHFLHRQLWKPPSQFPFPPWSSSTCWYIYTGLPPAAQVILMKTVLQVGSVFGSPPSWAKPLFRNKSQCPQWCRIYYPSLAAAPNTWCKGTPSATNRQGTPETVYSVLDPAGCQMIDLCGLPRQSNGTKHVNHIYEMPRHETRDQVAE